jgi:hypothetical protein
VCYVEAESPFDQRNFCKVEKWSGDERRIEEMMCRRELKSEPAGPTKDQGLA